MKPRSDYGALNKLPYGVIRHRVIREPGSGALIIQRGCQAWGKGWNYQGRCSPQADSVEELEAFAAAHEMTIDFYDLPENSHCCWHPLYPLPCPVCALRSCDSYAVKRARHPKSGKGLG